MDVQETEVQTDRIFTIPNILSFARLLGVPLFLWLVLVPQADLAAFALLVVSGITDWLDGVIARATGQISRLGQLLDPLADRLYVAATLIGLALRAIIPWWLVVLVLARDVVLAIMNVLYDGLADSKYRPCPLLVKYVEAGWLGQKSGRGFYDYRGEKPVPTR